MFDDEADRRDSQESSSTGCSSLSSTTDSTETVTDCCSVVESFVTNRDHLSLYPWFHGSLSRNDASSVIANLKDGVFLLRYSANQRCFAITFSYHGKAKVNIYFVNHFLSYVNSWLSDLFLADIFRIFFLPEIWLF